MSCRKRPFLLLLAAMAPFVTTAFTTRLAPQVSRTTTTPPPLYSTFAADGSEYKADQSDYEQDEDESTMMGGGGQWSSSDSYNRDDFLEDEDDTPTMELKPTPLSKNAGSRFLAVIWDANLVSNKEKDALDRHYDRIALTEEHVLYCRKTNLYNETFNQNSMVDIRSSYQL